MSSVQLSEPTLLPLFASHLSVFVVKLNSCCSLLSVSHAIDHVLIAQLYNPAFLTDPLLPCSLQRSSGDTKHCLRRRFPKISCQTTESTMPMIHEQMDRNKWHAGWDANPSSNQRRGNVFEDIRADERVFQFIGSVNANITTAKSVSAKSFATQCLGDLSNPSLQQISSDRRPLSLKTQLDSQAQLILRRPKGKSGKSEQTNYDVRD